VSRCEKVVAFGYPLHSQNLKSTSGVVSGHFSLLIERFSGRCIQIDAPINPGNSGGPLLNKDGVVVGVINASKDNAQNYNFAIPVNNLKTVLPDMYEQPLLKINNIDLTWANGTDEIRNYYGNPLTYGCFICNVDDDGNAQAVGLQAGDMLYEIDGYVIDSYGEIKLPYNDDKIAFTDYIAQLSLGANISLLFYRNGVPLNCVICLNNCNTTSISFKYPIYEAIDYEIFAGLIIMELTLNHIEACGNDRPGLRRYLTNLYNHGPRLIVANIFPESQLDTRMRTIRWADTINEVNGHVVTTLDDFREALLKSVGTGRVVIQTTDELRLNTDNVLTILSLYESCKETIELSYIHKYELSETVLKLIEQTDSSLL
jgi:serine protease Do